MDWYRLSSLLLTRWYPTPTQILLGLLEFTPFSLQYTSLFSEIDCHSSECFKKLFLIICLTRKLCHKNLCITPRFPKWMMSSVRCDCTGFGAVFHHPRLAPHQLWPNKSMAGMKLCVHPQGASVSTTLLFFYILFSFIWFLSFSTFYLWKVSGIEHIYFEMEICSVIGETFEENKEADDGRRSQGSVRTSCGKPSFNFGILESRKLKEE